MAKKKNKLVHSAARNFFLYLLMFITLYITAISTAGIIWQIIDIYVVDLLDSYYGGDYAKTALRGYLSAVIVAAPVYFYLAIKLNKESKSFKEVANSAVKRWLTYGTLLVAAIIVIVALISLVNNLLEGETTLRFFLHTLDVLVITGLVFGYYLWDLNRNK